MSQETKAVSGVDINLSEAFSVYSDSGKEIIVAVVDTGIDYTHSELEGKLWINEDEIAGNGIDDDQNGYIDDVRGWNFYNNSNSIYAGSEDDHGTHGAGTIVAASDNGEGISGIALSENIKVMSVKALGGKTGGGNTASIIRAIQYAEANGAQICNLSLGTMNNDRALCEVIKKSHMLFVVASGNDGKNADSAPSYPASYNLPNIISVANLNYDGTLHYSSNYGRTSVDIAAPGSYVLSTTSGNGYSYMTGTSMSAPMVSGAAALIYSHFGDEIDVFDTKEIILLTAKPLEGLYGTSVTGGMLDLGAALSFDISKLAEEKTKKEQTETKGSAPEINVSLVQNGNEQYLAVSVYDKDGNIKELKYANGNQRKEYFVNSGEILTLNENKTVLLKPETGIFTFWAVDEMGNETMCVVEVTERRKSRRGKQHGNPFASNFPGMMHHSGAEDTFHQIADELFYKFFDFFRTR